MRIITILLLALIFVSFNRDEVPLSWATTCDYCYVTSANLLDAVNNGVFEAKTTVPNTHNYLTRSQANALVKLDPELTTNGNYYVRKIEMNAAQGVPCCQYPPITIDCYNTSDALNSQLTVNFQNITGNEPYVPPFNPPYNEEIEDSGIEAYYHTVRVTVTNTSPYDVAVTILVEQFSGDTHSVNINFVVGTNSSDYREFTLPYNPGPGGLLNRTISIVLSEGG